jgi:alkanesulfonate monooxygenase SsuD/methylene tetrahydromethanopterin reductase-like flavin-dependent oxidoreductase (luciferase family)
LTEYAPYFYGNPINQGADLEHAVANTGLTVGSPQQVIDKVLRFPKYFGRTSRILFGVDFAGVSEKTVREQLDLLGEQVLPVLRRELGDA